MKKIENLIILFYFVTINILTCFHLKSLFICTLKYFKYLNHPCDAYKRFGQYLALVKS
jgi:hypothetical protein